MAGGSIPANLAPIFIAAGQQEHIPPAVLAGVASVETNLGQNRSTSSAGALGLMQFMPATARSLGINPFDDRQAIFGAAKLLNQYGYQQNPSRALGAYNGGPGNPQYSYAQQVVQEANRLASELQGPGGAVPQDMGGVQPGAAPTGSGSQTVPTFNQAGYQQAKARYIAGSFLAEQHNPFDIGPKGASTGSNPLLGPGLLTTKAPNISDFQGTKTIQLATGALQQVAGMGLVNTHSGAQGYVNPIPGAVLGRTDMGVDATLKPGAPIRAIGDSRVLGIMPGWYSGQPYLALQLLNGPQKGRTYYVAEQIQPRVRPGDVVRAGQTIATFAPSGTGIEIGWAGPNWQQTLAQAQGNTGDASHNMAPAGVNFRSFLGSLGA